jgi:hypothetical protein
VSVQTRFGVDRRAKGAQLCGDDNLGAPIALITKDDTVPDAWQHAPEDVAVAGCRS